MNNIYKKWYILDASNCSIGRLSSNISYILQGKHKSDYEYNKDLGDYVIVINFSKILITGNKLIKKKYYKHTGYVGNLKEINLLNMLNKNYSYVLIHAVKGMLPKNKLSKKMILRLKIYKYNNHNHNSQKPIFIKNDKQNLL